MCVLRISGSRFDAEAYLGASELRPSSIFKAGEPRSPKSKPQGPTNQTSGFHVAVSDAKWSDLAQQIDDACAFLARHEAELRVLTAMPEVEDARLDFPTNLRMGKSNVFAQCAYFPPQFIRASGLLGIGVELTIYPSADGDEDCENAGAA